MSDPFDSDFSYDFYLKLLRFYETTHELRPLCDFDPVAEGRAYLRHDIDLCIDSALAMAEIEADSGISSTYMLIPNSPLYDIGSRARDVRKIQSLGHEIAIHFDVSASNVDPENAPALLAEIDRQCDLISEISGEPIRSVSFHRPLPIFLRGADLLGRRVNGYAARLMDHYRSDSAGRWRQGNPMDDHPDMPICQLLTHPIWWGREHLSPPDRLEQNFRDRSVGLGPEDRIALSALFVQTVPGIARTGAST